MNEYEITITNMTDEDMYDITTALHEAGIDGEDTDDIGKYLRNNKPVSVFVNPSQVGPAVTIINGLGFETDEDETEDEDMSDALDYNPDFS